VSMAWFAIAKKKRPTILSNTKEGKGVGKRGKRELAIALMLTVWRKVVEKSTPIKTYYPDYNTLKEWNQWGVPLIETPGRGKKDDGKKVKKRRTC